MVETNEEAVIQNRPVSINLDALEDSLEDAAQPVVEDLVSDQRAPCDNPVVDFSALSETPCNGGGGYYADDDDLLSGKVAFR